MLKFFIPILLILFFVGCSDKTTYAPDEKIYEYEDLDILLAIEFAKSGHLKQSIELFDKLYKNTGRFEYLFELVQLQIEAGEFVQARDNIQSYEKQDIKLQRIVVISYIQEGDFDRALEVALSNLDISNENIDYRLISDIYLTIKDYPNAFNYLQSAYAKDQSIQNLLPMIRVLVSYLDKDSDALAYLQTYIKTHGFEQEIYTQILAIHSKNENVAGMKSALMQLYENTGNEHYAENILSIYGYLNDTEGAIEFLKHSHYNQKLLFDLYKANQNYEGALILAKSEYQKTDDPVWLANIAILKYELKYPLQTILDDFETAITKGVQDAVFLNYYGYIMIDHSVDIPYGIELVQKALEQNPDSVYYLDSLAWGYYKLGRCDEAKELIPLIEHDKSTEIQEHIEKIQRCKE